MPPNVGWGALLEFRVERRKDQFVPGVPSYLLAQRDWAKDVRVIEPGLSS